MPILDPKDAIIRENDGVFRYPALLIATNTFDGVPTIELPILRPLVVSTPLKNISQIGSSSQLLEKIKTCSKPPTRYDCVYVYIHIWIDIWDSQTYSHPSEDDISI